MADKFFMIDKQLMADIISTLKSIHPMDYDSMDKLVGCVSVLEVAMNPPQPVEETEKKEINPKELLKERDTDG